uniref:EF-hand domain-containing protein n=1 Tax=Rhizochromulina marina TaxID=1034831 RepID=A0A7S2WV09_9STRA|mmetsp:Transcript_751/g.2415  ORF Transcript_751/g.2415 Transcript_751/m.2415 type:complete len:375 (+) Transcript_751:191-1315(+)|eukprot:CAMPEP_0118979540 /NCGR_PEP_ID=MMETSP1173-20130426/26221_1 /TAXON_ID=1034831 /ORGANISM="Rhizochromulina marina cf, Strain CCMP1243" /LENGTH=374 /DNA_ID=CAMNT_0006929809 /DNA_START=104 /DNA_END=1228 /DNA_ORIENTATION=+
MNSPPHPHAPDGAGADSYTAEEIHALKGIFALYDPDKTGSIPASELESLLEKIGYTGDSKQDILAASKELSNVTFEEFLQLIEKGQPQQPGEGPDPKVMEFLRILEEYRLKCEDEGDYLEAGRAQEQLETLRRQEEKRQQKAVRARQIAERSDVQIAHNMQYQDFNKAWDRYLEEYDKMAQMYIQQMTERHAVNLLDFQRNLQSQMAEKPPKWSRELLEWRRRQHMLARQKNYAEAQRIKKIADKLEDKERKGVEQDTAIIFARKEAQFRQQQQAELQALLKRIDARRKEHIKQRNLDSKRLMQRNRNVQAVLESKQAVESNRIFSEIRKNLAQITAPRPRVNEASGMGQTGGSKRKTKKSTLQQTQQNVAVEE